MTGSVSASAETPVQHPTVSHVDGSLPTYLHGSGITRLWSPKLLRWLTTKEKFASTGWPVTEDIAAALGVELFDVRALGKRGHELIGNSMRIGCASLVILSALICAALAEFKELAAPLPSIDALPARVKVPQDRRCFFHVLHLRG